jgi:Rps23 Pro-64 3,4-dihydroxylase Tpa1-like proline 4-hydroxylase
VSTEARSNYFYFDSRYLSELSTRLAAKYQTATPFPHVVIDNFIPDEHVIDEVLREFPTPGSVDWIHYNQQTEKKLASRDESQIGSVTRHLLQQFNSSVFCLFLERLTGIEGIIPDPHFWGGGLHQIERGGFLKIHSDFNRYEKLKLDRRLNVLLYLNRNWKEEFGGHLELWSQDMKRREQMILPVANRCVIFSTASRSYHGHPEALMCPQGWTRKSLALYYYSNGSPQNEKTYSTDFQARPGERFTNNARSLARRLVPPIVLDFLKAFRRTK